MRKQRRAAQLKRRTEGEAKAQAVLKSLPRGFGDWLAGFLDGEGYFGIYHQQPPGAKELNYYVTFKLALSSADAAIIGEIQATLGGIGRVTHYRARRAEKQYPAIQWAVTKKADLIVLATVLDKFPMRAKKAHEYAVWRKAVYHWWLDFDERPVDWSRMAFLHDEILAVRHNGYASTLI